MITFDFPPMVGGIQTRAENYVKNLARMGHNVNVIHIIDPEVIKSFYGGTIPSEGFSESFLGARVFRYTSSIRKIFRIFFGALKE
ncbi:MAG: hypothetical protein KIH10_17785, partial [Candidatus Freyarchaeota archaeon]|nr:hypothetical protein [Candidatus Jordarchaeia archaeon]